MPNVANDEQANMYVIPGKDLVLGVYNVSLHALIDRILRDSHAFMQTWKPMYEAQD